MSVIALTARRAMYTISSTVNHALPPRNDKIVLFSYHSVARDNWRYSIDPDMLKRQVDELLTSYQPIQMRDVEDILNGDKNLSQPSFVLAFDDGYKDVLNMESFFHDRGIVPTLYVLAHPDRADQSELTTQRPLLSYQELRRLAESGWEIGCHSATHRDFWGLTDEELSFEIVQAKEDIEASIGRPIRYFAYPRGRYNTNAKMLVKKAGYALAVSMDDGYVTKSHDRYTLPRIGVDRTHSPHEFRVLHTDGAIIVRGFVKKMLKRFL